MHDKFIIFFKKKHVKDKSPEIEFPVTFVVLLLLFALFLFYFLKANFFS